MLHSVQKQLHLHWKTHEDQSHLSHKIHLNKFKRIGIKVSSQITMELNLESMTER